jgi:hypothetical protein
VDRLREHCDIGPNPDGTSPITRLKAGNFGRVPVAGRTPRSLWHHDDPGSIDQ